MGDDYSDIYSGDPNTSTSVGVPVDYSTVTVLPGDVSDAQQMNPWTPPAAAQQGAPWWAGIAAYGITKAIDNQFPGSPSGIMGNTYPGSAQGANGRTYTLRPIGAGGGAVGASAKLSVSGNTMLLLALAAAAIVLMK